MIRCDLGRQGIPVGQLVGVIDGPGTAGAGCSESCKAVFLRTVGWGGGPEGEGPLGLMKLLGFVRKAYDGIGSLTALTVGSEDGK